MNYKVNKEKCLGCGLCVVNCPGGTELKEDGKAAVSYTHLTLPTN